ncbi:neuronal acetylcholine receptor subunit alpha-7 isoform X1 [Petromyzon marinus]|uniref:Neuronal acetylcholine receptor subunit alpha-7 n=2 Tax=Petromyzon marinus TaxID=7757 RepID=A0AAJ7WQ98_PETMA|nr:neuronal acetylcholine receptor subunit alpha-7-like isoform X1 [Petromyzon marinus]
MCGVVGSHLRFTSDRRRGALSRSGAQPSGCAGSACDATMLGTRTTSGSCHRTWVWAIVLLCLVRDSLQGEYQRKLYRDLLKNYNPLERPVENDSMSISVQFQLILMQIMDVDEKNQVLTTNVWLQFFWKDHYLHWNYSEHPGVKNLRFQPHQIWTPDILLYNSADERFDATFHTNVLVNYTGNCQHLPPGMLKSTCYIDVRWFPFDVQKCDLKFGSWTHDGWLIDLQMLEADTSGYIANGEWDLVEIPGKRNELYYDCCQEPYPDVTYTLTIRRRTLYYGLNLLVPCVLISALSLLVFLLPADSGEKISLGITVLLSLTVFMLLVAEIMPATSDSVPLIGQYFASTMIIVAFSVVVTVIVLQYHHHNPDGKKMPQWVRVILLDWCAWFLRMKQPGRERHELARRLSILHRNSMVSLDLALLSASGIHKKTNGHGVFIGFTNPDAPQQPPTSDSGVMCGRETCFNSTGPEEEPGNAQRGMPPDPTAGMSSEITKILIELRYIAGRFRTQDENEAIASEWKFAAAVVDRLCLLAFTLFTIISTISILMSAPHFTEAVAKDFT